MMFGRGFYGQGACFGAGGLWGGLMMFGFFLIIGALVFWFIKKGTSKENNLVENLQTRYVLGEITEEEYLKKREILKRK